MIVCLNYIKRGLEKFESVGEIKFGENIVGL